MLAPALQFTLLLLPIVLSQYTGPFTQVNDGSVNGLSGVTDFLQKEGPEDHLVECRGNLVLLVIDTGSVYTLTSTDTGATWTYGSPGTTMCTDGTQLADKDAGYSMGMTVDPISGLERILVVGGDDIERNVFMSDDCGQTFFCQDNANGNSEWTPRRFTWIAPAPWNTTGPHALLIGGLTSGSVQGRGVYHSWDMGTTWERPRCTGPNLGPEGGCNNGAFFQLPKTPAYPGNFVPHPDGTLYFYLTTFTPEEPYELFFVNAALYCAYTGALAHQQPLPFPPPRRPCFLSHPATTTRTLTSLWVSKDSRH